MMLDTPSDLADTTQQADYLIITPEAFSDALLPLIQHRESKGLAVKLVTLEDIYDEFSYGITTPYAIKEFVTYAYTNWMEPAPRYVLLVGDATYDYKNNLELAPAPYVPTYLLMTEFTGETGSDEWFVRVSGDDLLSDLYIGRLPAASQEEATAMINRIIDYEESPEDNTWQRHLYFVAGSDYLVVGESDTFQDINENASLLAPSPYQISRSYATTQGIEGALIINYAGHGYLNTWYMNDGTQDMDAILAYLNTADTLPVFVNMTCLNGYFIDKLGNPRSLAETLLTTADRGAIASLSSTGSTVPSGQRLLDYGLFEAIFTKEYRDLGAAISYAKAYLLANSTTQQDVANTFLLFGDPAMEVKIPVPRTPTGLTASPGVHTIELSWEANEEDDLAGYNLYRSTTSGGGYEKVNTSPITDITYQDDDITTGVPYYYVLSAVDVASLESGASPEVSSAGESGVGSGKPASTGGGCFIATAGSQ
jgi:hypothetical protein